jgi:lysozyme
MTTICVDISHWQEGFNFQAFKDGGGLGVICKATEGVTFKDKSYPHFRKTAHDAGLKFASYHFLKPSSAIAQATAYLAYAKPVKGERVVADWEDDEVDAKRCVTFLKQIHHARPDLQLTVYSGHTAKEQLTDTDPWLRDHTSLWVAQYTTAREPSWPISTWDTWSLWQYTDRGSAPGFEGDLDLDRFNGADEQFLAWMGPAEQKRKSE